MADKGAKKPGNEGSTGSGTTSDSAAGPVDPLTPKISVRTQYVKDLSFENPRAPETLADNAASPTIQVKVDVKARPLGGNHYEAALQINASGKRDGVSVFVVELVYAGLFALENVASEQLEAVCLVECPQLLFPFARRVIADATRDGGFPPLLLNPIDFGRLYRERQGSTTKI